jgi:AraC-like DNA-binding protein
MKPRAGSAKDGRKSLGFRAGLGTPYPMRVSHAHGDLELNFVFSGKLRYFMGGRFVEIPRRTLAAFWAALPHQTLDVSADANFMWINIPLVTLLRWNLGSPFMSKIFAGELMLDPEGPAWEAEVLKRWLSEMNEGDAKTLRTVELELEARLRRLAFQPAQRTAARLPERKNCKPVEDIAAYLAQHFREELTIGDIGKAVGLHPNYAMTIFRRECGIPIWQYLTRLRLSHAQLMLLSTDETVLAIALDSGFGSLARFYATFKKECGMSPGEYRQRAQ